MVKNWKTSLAGLIAIGSTLQPLLSDLVKGDYAGAWGQVPVIALGIAAILAKDFDVHV